MKKEHRRINAATTIVRMKKVMLLATVLLFSMFSFLGSAGAMEFAFGPDTKLDCDIIFTYGGAVRASGTNKEKLVEPNTDDADRNFDQWDLVNNKLTTVQGNRIWANCGPGLQFRIKL